MPYPYKTFATTIRFKKGFLKSFIIHPLIAFTKEHPVVIVPKILVFCRFPATREYFQRGVAKIKCEAEIAGGVWATSQSQVGRIPG